MFIPKKCAFALLSSAETKTEKRKSEQTQLSKKSKEEMENQTVKKINKCTSASALPGALL